MVIRRYTLEDGPAVFALHRRAMEGTGGQLLTGPGEDDLRAIEEHYLTNGEFLVGVIDEEIIAMGALRPTKEAGVAELRRMRVDERHRRKGYGQAILQSLEKRARELGYSSIILDVGTPQLPAQRLYEKNGYVRTHEDAIEGIPVFWYRKEL